ncbi:hypothetical protein Verru16b_02266 [Lacunisphaera limnophila]|uniref:Uncharacterized protein n=1 Tax=Lacunisphaera limnophila TaxID=1838286 RepID=A0A1D8AWB6_9BACT|nr:hypothetical protein [Lacunisphaera limnophila]AOS45188.1 hypothetical protein Verru16b_02266 [Lacunisphaera limnophila]
MKTLRLLLLLATLAPALPAALPETAPAIPATTNVTVASPASELAAGYAAAIQQMSPKSLVVFFQSDNKVASVKGIRTARALHGVVLITFSAGDMMALNAERIVLITDGARTPQG